MLLRLRFLRSTESEMISIWVECITEISLRKFRLHNITNIRQQRRQCLDRCRSVKTYSLSYWLTAVPWVRAEQLRSYLDCANSLNFIREGTVQAVLQIRLIRNQPQRSSGFRSLILLLWAEQNSKINSHFLASHHRKQKTIVRGQRLLPFSQLSVCVRSCTVASVRIVM